MCWEFLRFDRLKFPNEWHELENTQNNSVKIDEAPRLSVINVCHIRSFGNCFRLNLFQGIPGPVGIKGPKGRQVNALSFISCHQGYYANEWCIFLTDEVTCGWGKCKKMNKESVLVICRPAVKATALSCWKFLCNV